MKFSVIYADPPWVYRDRNTGGSYKSGAAQVYDTMTLDDICALPVKGLAADDCTLFMWCTWPHYESASQVMRAWGFEYKTVGFVWIKTNKGAAVDQYSFLPTDSFDDFFGLGHWTRGNTEFCLIGVKGKPRRVSNDVRQIIYQPIGEHSEKPAEARRRIVQLMGDLPRVELFARERAEGWHAWGNEVGSDIDLAA
jgi:N6-adenosine-specific RNA methylase IME4